MNSNEDSFEAFDKLISATPERSAAATMSSLQIAEITGKNHADVMRDIRSVLEQAEIDQSKFAGVYLGGNGQERPCYQLPRRECDLVVSGYSVKYRLAIIDRWQELEAKQSAPAALPSYPEALRLYAAELEKTSLLKTTVLELTPKAEALELIAGADGLMNITTAAKTLQIQPKRLFAYLDTHGWTYRTPGRSERVPYQSKIAQGLMTMKAHRFTNAQTGEEQVAERALITPKGLARLAESIKRDAA